MALTITYRHPAGVVPSVAERPLLSTPEGGFIALDDGLVALWRAADGRTFDALVEAPSHPDVDGIVAESLACLSEAGLLQRSTDATRDREAGHRAIGGARVTAVIVVSVPAELTWLDDCVRALMRQDYATEILVLDNAVGVEMRPWLVERGLEARVHSLQARTNFSSALNAGCAAAPGSDFFLLLNADMKADRSCVGHLVERAQATPDCAAVAPKLYLWRAPAFLNGIGNRVPGWGYGTDNGIGQLDLSQLDHWTEVPSGCFGALLVSASALQTIGRFDARYPMYYEDTDWCYRARVQGLHIAAAPKAFLFHVFGATSSGAEPSAMHSRKLESVLIGQLRFGVKVGSPGRAAILTVHALKDASTNVRGAAREGRGRTLMAYGRAAVKTMGGLPRLLIERRRIQSRRRVADAEVFRDADDLTPSFVWRNLPELTSDSVRSYYAQLIRSGRTRPLPEIPSTMMR
jgi:GT2 family glycosyltransferase